MHFSTIFFRALAAGLFFSSAPQVLAASADDVQAGAEFARRKCLMCHKVAGSPGSGTQRAPSFEESANGPHGGESALRDFLKSTHSSVAHPGAMPHPSLTEEETREAIAYLQSLKKP